ncbi:hypothetical protein [Nocardia brevicatena]|uniref:hypothetical protein n=1 Tax=Nocardia brevicatena TaxID=37327 RepID=UPI0002EC68DE|nr:hypothetical protein [Nocardia brevicatena]
MKLRKSAVGAAMVAAALTLGVGTAHADPAPTPAEHINYAVQMVGKTVVTTLQGGTFAITEQSAETPEGQPISEAPKEKFVEVKDPHGNVVMSWPVDFKVGDISVPVTPVLKNDDKVLELTPQQTGVPVAQPVNTVSLTAKPIASPSENQRAMQEFGTQFGLATSVGGFLGTAVGVVAGGLIGCILGLPLLGVGCIPAAIAGAGIGGILGTVAVGGPTLAIAGMELLNTMQAAPGTSKWANDGKPK